MTRRLVLLAPLFVLAACPGDPGNPKTLWLASDRMETKVHLIDHEPTPF
jgi:hypothetical protein